MSLENYKIVEIKPIKDVALPILAQQTRRFQSSLGHLLTTATASLAVMSLFLYIFGDFLREKLPEISPTSAERARFYFIAVIIFLSAAALSRWARQIIYEPQGWITFLKSLGLKEQNLIRSALLSIAATIGLGLLATCVVLNFFVGPLSYEHVILTFILICAVSIYVGKVPNNYLSPKDQSPHSSQSCVEKPLVSWRSSRLMAGRWRGSSLRVLAALPIVLGTTAHAAGNPKELAYLACLLGGIILSWTVPLLIEEDLRFTWIERQAAVSHDDWMMAWQSIFNRWSRPIFVTTLILYLISSLVSRHWILSWNNVNDIGTMVAESIVAGILASFPVWLAPAFILQIDGRKITTNVVMLTLINIFAGTAIIAAPLLAPILFLLQKEAHRYQEGRFARASHH